MSGEGEGHTTSSRFLGERSSKAMSAIASRIMNRVMSLPMFQIAKTQAEFYSKAAGEFRDFPEKIFDVISHSN